MPKRRFEFVPFWAMISVFFIYAMRQIDCPECGVKVELVPWVDVKLGYTLRYRVVLPRWASRLSWNETSGLFGSSYDTVFWGVEWVVRCGRSSPKNRRLRGDNRFDPDVDSARTSLPRPSTDRRGFRDFGSLQPQRKTTHLTTTGLKGYIPPSAICF